MAGTLPSPPRCSLGSVSPKVMRRLLVFDVWMIAPSRRRRKGRPMRYDALMTKPPKSTVSAIFFQKDVRSLTVSLGNFTMKPNFEQPRAVLDCEKRLSRLGLGCVRAPDSSAP